MKFFRVVLPFLACAAFANPRAVLPDAVVDLRTPAGAARVQAQWRYSDTSISAIDHRAVGPDLKASGPKNRPFDFTPDARAATFDDSKWEIIPADSLEQRRGNGRLALSWYRLTVTIPEKVGRFETRGSTVAFEIVVDDYAEVWVNGQLPFVLGQTVAGLPPDGTRRTAWCSPAMRGRARNFKSPCSASTARSRRIPTLTFGFAVPRSIFTRRRKSAGYSM
jgi:hypothetical protein